MPELPSHSAAPTAFVLAAQCDDRQGIMRAVTEFIDRRGFSISEHQQFDDATEGRFFLRTSFAGPNPDDSFLLSRDFEEIARAFNMEYEFTESRIRPRIGVLVSREGHCLNDLVYRWRSDELGGDLVAVMSNHESLRAMAEAADLPFQYTPVTAATKVDAERSLRAMVSEHALDLIVLARYMQVLSDDFCRDHPGRVINIHHSFLPGFKGARPYQQAHTRGVKYVGATAHYVTADLDEGPIIEQEVIRVTHALSATDLARVGRDAEALALSRAVRWHCERRVLLNGRRTVVFA